MRQTIRLEGEALSIAREIVALQEEGRRLDCEMKERWKQEVVNLSTRMSGQLMHRMERLRLLVRPQCDRLSKPDGGNWFLDGSYLAEHGLAFVVVNGAEVEQALEEKTQLRPTEH